MRIRISAGVREKKARCTPKPSSSHDCGPESASSSAKRSLPSAVIRYTRRARRDHAPSGGAGGVLDDQAGPGQPAQCGVQGAVGDDAQAAEPQC